MIVLTLSGGVHFVRRWCKPFDLLYNITISIYIFEKFVKMVHLYKCTNTSEITDKK